MPYGHQEAVSFRRTEAVPAPWPQRSPHLAAWSRVGRSAWHVGLCGPSVPSARASLPRGGRHRIARMQLLQVQAGQASPVACLDPDSAEIGPAKAAAAMIACSIRYALATVIGPNGGEAMGRPSGTLCTSAEPRAPYLPHSQVAANKLRRTAAPGHAHARRSTRLTPDAATVPWTIVAGRVRPCALSAGPAWSPAA